jgi:hypothetical protein
LFSRFLISAFFAVLFLQSGIDKVLDRRGNLDWLTGHFAKSPLARMVGLLLSMITIMELAAGALSALGCLLILFRHDATVAFYGAVHRRPRFTRPLFRPADGERLSGAAALVPYFLVVIAGIIWLGQG